MAIADCAVISPHQAACINAIYAARGIAVADRAVVLPHQCANITGADYTGANQSHILDRGTRTRISKKPNKSCGSIDG